MKDLKEAQYVCDYILQGGNAQEFLAKFEVGLVFLVRVLLLLGSCSG